MKLHQCHTAFSKREEMVIGNDSIARVRDGVETSAIRFDEVKSVRLVCEGHSQPHGKAVYRCIVKSNNKTMKFSNAIFKNDVSGMDKTYTRFVQSLHKQLAPHSHQISFHQGSNLHYYCIWFAVVCFTLALISLPFVVYLGVQWGTGLGVIIRKGWVFALIPFFMAGVAKPILRRGKSKNYDGKLPPGDFLPTAG